jgi:predicted nucleic acid-binding protein
VPEIISNTSPLLYLYRVGILDWLPRLFSKIWTSTAVSQELREGQRKGHDVPDLQSLSWLEITEPQTIPSEWLALDLGAGELSVLALALENPDRFVLLDDGLARRVAQAAGLNVWGTLKVLLEAQSQGFTGDIESCLDKLQESGMWISQGIRQRVLSLSRMPRT